MTINHKLRPFLRRQVNPGWARNEKMILETAARLIKQNATVSYSDIGNACEPPKFKQSVHRVLKANKWKFYKSRSVYKQVFKSVYTTCRDSL